MKPKNTEKKPPPLSERKKETDSVATLPAEVLYLTTNKNAATPSLPSLTSVLRNTVEPSIQFEPSSAILKSVSAKNHAKLVETVKKVNQLNIGTTTSYDHTI